VKNRQEILSSIEACLGKEATVKFSLANGDVKTGQVIHIVKDEYVIIKKKSLLVIPTHDVVEVSNIRDVGC
jgi:hypothetical protein